MPPWRHTLAFFWSQGVKRNLELQPHASGSRPRRPPTTVNEWLIALICQRDAALKNVASAMRSTGGVKASGCNCRSPHPLADKSYTERPYTRRQPQTTQLQYVAHRQIGVETRWRVMRRSGACAAGRRKTLGAKPSVCGDATRANRACDRRADYATVLAQCCSNDTASAMGTDVMAWVPDSARQPPRRRVWWDPAPVTSHVALTSAVLPMVELAPTQSGVRCGSAVRVQRGREETLGAKPSVCGDAVRASCACDCRADCATV
jgi:hypothetical protein